MRSLLLACLLLFSLPIYAQDNKDALSAAMDFYNAGNYADALPLFGQIIDKYEMDLEQSYSLNYYAGYCARNVGDQPAAYNYMHTALDNAIKLGEESQIPVLHMFVADAQRELGEYDDAADHYKLATELLPEKSIGLATAQYFLAETYRLNGDLEDSVKQCEQVVVTARELKLNNIEVSCLTSIGEAHNEAGKYQLAIKTFTEAMTIARNAQLPLEMANINMGLGLVYQALAKNDISRQHFEEALKFYVLCMNMTNVPMIVDRLTTLPPSTKTQAARMVEACKQYAETLSSARDEDSALYMQLLVGYYQGIAEDPEMANTYEQVLTLALAYSLPYQVCESAIALANLLAETEPTEAMATLEKARDFEDQQNQPQYLAKIYAEQGKLYAISKDLANATAAYQNAINSATTDEDKDRYRKELRAIR
ncbi:MAG: tetratricopeptide repeat protein [Deferribacteraceae bacterium]|jgi:tetratricopeptide (TPR) repeat protein|nr:tetratricopeptide repeat protein [Deferribacteraceae bacterium]